MAGASPSDRAPRARPRSTGVADTNQVELFREELKLDNAQERVQAMRRVADVARQVGPQATREALLPMLQAETEEDDELMRVLAEELVGFVDLVGGAEQAESLLPVLEAMCGVEETYVREEAVRTTAQVIGSMNDEGARNAAAMVKRMASDEWFPPRVSACGLFHAVHRRLPEADVRADFVQLCRDDTPMVRRAAAKAMASAICSADAATAATELVPRLEQLVRDDQETVRVLAVAAVGEAAVHLGDPLATEHLLPLVKQCAADRSWRVRQAIAEVFTEVARAMGPAVVQTDLVDPLASLMRDPEPEVRSTTARHLSGVNELSGSAFPTKIVPAMLSLAEDEQVPVRASVAESAMGMVPESTRHVMSVLTKALEDEEGEVRLKVLEGLGTLAHGAGGEDASRDLLPAVVRLANDPQWRVRAAVVATLPGMCRAMGAAYFDEHIMPLYLAAHEDEVDAVRSAAAAAGRDLAEAFGPQWATANLVPAVQRMFDSASYYMQRIQAVTTAHALTAAGDEALTAAVVDVLAQAATDPVPNVRIAACKALRDAAAHLSAESKSGKLKQALDEVCKDQDRDVRHFATEAAAAL